MQTPEGPSPEPSGLVPGPDPAPPSPLDPPGAPAGAKPAAKKAPILRISASQAQALGSVAAGASTVFLLGTAATLLVSLFPVQLVNSQWQLSQMANLVANGSWLLLGLVLLHLAVLLQPNQARLTQRLATLRWLAAGAAVLYLLLAPLQLVATWNGIDAVENTRGRVMGGTMARVKALRVAIQKASDLPDLRRRAAAIPGAPPIPEEAANLPFETLRRTLLGQLDTVETNVKRQLGQATTPTARQEIWRQTLRNIFTSLLLAIGFASGAQGWPGKPSLLASLLALRLPSLSRKIRLPKLTGLRAWQRGWRQAIRRRFGSSGRKRRASKAKPKASSSPSPSPISSSPISTTRPSPSPISTTSPSPSSSSRSSRSSRRSKRSRSFSSQLVKNWRTKGLRFWNWRL
jgi:hypothetical protein